MNDLDYAALQDHLRKYPDSKGAIKHQQRKDMARIMAEER